MKKRYGFDNQRMTELLNEYYKHPKDLELRNKIVRRSQPLIDAVVAKKRYFAKDPETQADLKQEMALKLIKALPRYKAGYGNAFAFIWTVLCNVAISKSIWLSKDPSLSLSNEDIMYEAEVKLQDICQSPENQHILNDLGIQLDKVFASNGFEVPRKRLHKKALRIIRKSVSTGELFYDKLGTLRKLKSLGLARRDIQSYIDYTLVVTRKKLLLAKVNADAIQRREANAFLPQYTPE